MYIQVFIMHDIIELLEHKRLIWRGNESRNPLNTLPTGYPELDNKLDGGLPKNGVIEIQTELGIGELRLLKSFMHDRCEDRLIAFIQAPGTLSAEFLASQGFDLTKVIIINPKNHKDALWAAEQCLKSGACGCVLLWQQSLEVHQAKRLQVACETGNSVQFIFKSQQPNVLSLPVSLSIALTPHQYGLEAKIIKRKGGWPQGSFHINMSAAWPNLTLKQPSSTILPFPKVKRG